MSASRRSSSEQQPQPQPQPQQSLSLDLEEQQGRAAPPTFVSYMGSRLPVAMAISRDQHDQFYQLNRLPYESIPSSRQPPAHPQQQQHVLEGGFFWPGAARSAGGVPPHFSSGPVAYGLRDSPARQEQETAGLVIPKHMARPQPQASRSDEPNTLDMNVRGMNLLAPQQRSWPDHHHQQLAQFHQLHQLQLQQQQHAQQQQQQHVQHHQQQQNIHHQRPDSPTVVAQLHRSGLQPILQHEQQHHQLHQQLQQAGQQQQHNLLASSSSTASAGGSSTCKECGNQAKKDCVYQRCRTCCKSRGFECSTHVRSTWVPAAKRRERQLAEAAAVASGQPRPKSKRNRVIAMQQQQLQLQHQQSSAEQVMILDEDITAVTPTTTNTSNSPHSDARQPQDAGSLPSEVRAQAVFKCVKVTSVEDGGEDEFAYQAVVRIGGRIFKGVLQDHGVDAGGSISGDTTSLGDLQQGGGGAAAAAATVGGGATATGGSPTPPQLLQLDPMFHGGGSSSQSHSHHFHQSSSREVE
ncbi:homeotic protein female sterile-like [Selaginella moellendorffii]|uniref:homeotic protein female sterile-like n=1 Tax=Selaginella moellendorffii TaxID=88036 RepID=UPI000D1C39C7|nr:homeotic protein female sterile-like [Selaginella moellendorffii]|eukprot:XP_024533252.1 homeotic protein female sterile-like [Selaginella moellendorffii]